MSRIVSIGVVAVTTSPPGLRSPPIAEDNSHFHVHRQNCLAARPDLGSGRSACASRRRSGSRHVRQALSLCPKRVGRPSTYRVADLIQSHPAGLVKPSMKKANDDVIAGKVPFRARERCWPGGRAGLRRLFAG